MVISWVSGRCVNISHCSREGVALSGERRCNNVYGFTDNGRYFVKDVKLARTVIGRTVRRLRSERALSQQALATRLGISASYLNLIEHDQRAVTASLLIKLAETLRVDLGELSGTQERQLELGLREAFSDPLLGADAVPEAEIAAMAGGSPNAARAVLALYRAWRVAREDASGIALPSGRRVLLPNEEARDFFDDHANHFPDVGGRRRHHLASLWAASRRPR